MPDYRVERLTSSLVPVASVYRSVGFRPDLVDDLELVRRLGGGVITANLDDQVVGASSYLPFGRTGWIGGVAVRLEHTRRGLGERLTDAAWAELRGAGARTVLLHATPMARPLYARMGFVATEEYVELRGSLPPGWPSGVRLGTVADLDAVLDLDRVATGEDRGGLIRALWPRGGAVVDGQPGGGVRGYRLQQSPDAVGAVVATDRRTAELLLSGAAEATGELRVGLPDRHTDTLATLAGCGFHRTSGVTRMHSGPALDDRPDWVCATFNLYWG